MRSDIAKLLETEKGRFELCQQAFKAIRMMHNPGRRIQDTTHDVLQRLSGVERHEVLGVSKGTNKAEREVVQEAAVIEPQAGKEE
jgi:hypothetical protein